MIKAFTDVIDNKGTYTINLKRDSKIVIFEIEFNGWWFLGYTFFYWWWGSFTIFFGGWKICASPPPHSHLILEQPLDYLSFNCYMYMHVCSITLLAHLTQRVIMCAIFFTLLPSPATTSLTDYINFQILIFSELNNWNNVHCIFL